MAKTALQPEINSSPVASNTSSASQEIDLTALFQVVWRRKWSIILLTLLSMALASVVVMNIEPTYRASTTLLITDQANKVVSIDQIYGLDGLGNNFIQTQIGLIRSRSTIERAVKQLNLTSHPAYDPRQAVASPYHPRALVKQAKDWIPGLTDLTHINDQPIELTEQEVLQSVVNRLLGQLSVENVRGSNLVVIHVESTDRALAARAANAIAEAFIEGQLDAAIDATLSATNWMNNRLIDLRDSLQSSESRLRQFLESENLIDLDGIEGLSARELTGLNTQLLEARRKRAEIESEFTQIRDLSSEGWESWVTTPPVMRNTMVQSIRSDLARAQARVDELSNRYGPRHPVMQSAMSDLNAAQTNLRLQVEQIVSSIERNYQVAIANERSLERSVEENKEAIQRITRNQFRLNELQREVSTNQALFDTFMTRLKETTATSDLQTSNARISDPAVVPIHSVKPKKSLIVAVVGILVAMLATFIVLLLNMLNNTFRTADDIESRLNLPVLGILPLLRKVKNRQAMANIYVDNKDRAFSESVKTIRTSVMLSSIDQPHLVLMVTSSIPGEGKSTSSINLAYGLGQMQKVLYIEADMRRPTLAKTLGYAPGSAGLANLIAGNAEFDSTVQSHNGIDILVAGVVPPNPLELLSSTRFKALVDELKQNYDCIIIDSPPIQAVSDPLIISAVADSVIYITKYDSTPIKLVEDGIGSLLQHNASVKGIIMNQVDIKKAQKQGYSYSGYYDYYGYSSNASKSA